MFSWRAPTLPRLPGRGPVVRVHDSAAQELRATGAGDSGRASLYVCGITPYDATHLGHAATYLAFDTLQRAWRDAGLDVRYVQNVTDVDEPLFERAKATGQDWSTLAEHETSRFRDDMAALRVIPPDHYVGAVEAMPQIVDLAVRLRDTGHTYELDGDVYFASSGPGAVESGRVAHLGSEEMLALSRERGGDPDRAGKKDPLDPLLWQAERPGEPGWDSPFGRGRPGWHVECAAIALHYLGPCIDVQGGGRDLAFPHHELGAAEAEAATGAVPFARAYV
ncbi:MAG TPA: cysteine--1-D-myo-inosityl 2-amino-2-deoxy-alpha-D-glucopyranoside ligase, partial [Mycobacteriales bacterium]|nr:cysteine--1-D-myo-inosityl 2-amino-2-deoxy-alpha-D-glucopyranoside ligase [Mycobacteriales bacterium]